MGLLSQNNGYSLGRWGVGDKSGARGRGILILTLLYFMTSAVLTWVLTVYSLKCTHYVWSVLFSYDIFHTHKDILWEIFDGYVPIIVQRKAVSVFYLIFYKGFCFCLNKRLTEKWEITSQKKPLFSWSLNSGRGGDGYKQPQVNNMYQLG